MPNLPAEICRQIDIILAKYPKDKRQSAVVSALMLIQQLNDGSLNTELMDLLAEYIGMPKIAVYEVASFYSLFDLQPVGKHKIFLCAGVSCYLCGGEEIIEYIKTKLQIDVGQTTKDRRFTLKNVECLASCGGAPMMQIDGQYYENLTRDKIDKILGCLT